MLKDNQAGVGCPLDDGVYPVASRNFRVDIEHLAPHGAGTSGHLVDQVICLLGFGPVDKVMPSLKLTPENDRRIRGWGQGVGKGVHDSNATVKAHSLVDGELEGTFEAPSFGYSEDDAVICDSGHESALIRVCG